MGFSPFIILILRVLGAVKVKIKVPASYIKLALHCVQLPEHRAVFTVCCVSWQASNL